jgi:hypothetical protein
VSADDGRDLGVDDPGGLAGEAVEVRGEVLGLVFWRAIATDVFGAQALDRDLDDVSLTRWGGRLDEPGDVTSGGGDGLAALGKERGPELLDGVRSQLRIEALPIELIGPEGRQKGVFAVLGELGQEVRLRWGYFVTCTGCKLRVGFFARRDFLLASNRKKKAPHRTQNISRSSRETRTPRTPPLARDFSRETPRERLLGAGGECNNQPSTGVAKVMDRTAAGEG